MATYRRKNVQTATGVNDQKHEIVHEARFSLDGAADSRMSSMKTPRVNLSNWALRQPLWVILAVASGACAAANGVFAKLTTTALTSTLADDISHTLHLGSYNDVVDYVVRASFFGLNLLFNALMWGLFTAALARGDSTTRVSIVNVSANFMITAILGWMIFGESLPWLWWIGAAFLAVGNVVIGRREEGQKPGETTGLDGAGQEVERLMSDNDLLELDEHEVQNLPIYTKDADEQLRVKEGVDVDAPI